MPNRVHPSHLAVVTTERAEPGSDAGNGPVRLEFDAVYAQHAAYVAGLVGRILGHNDEVPDAVQEVFLIVYRRLRDVRHPEALRTWLGRIAVREASRRLRWRRVGRLFGQTSTIDAALVGDDGAAAELRPLVALMYATLDRVAAAPRVAWVLRHLLDEPLNVVAEICGCSLATAKRRIAAAEVLLRPVFGDDSRDPPAESKEDTRG